MFGLIAKVTGNSVPLGAYQQKCKEASDAIEALEKGRKRWTDQMKEKDNEICKNLADVNRLTSELQGAYQVNHFIRRENNKLGDEIKDARSAQLRASAELTAIQSRLEQLEKTINVVTNERDAFQIERNKLLTDNTHLMERLHECEDIARGLDKHLSEARNVFSKSSALASYLKQFSEDLGSVFSPQSEST